jgi:hypothetical protein
MGNLDHSYLQKTGAISGTDGLLINLMIWLENSSKDLALICLIMFFISNGK